MNQSDWNLYRMKAEVVKAVAHPIRLAILDCLRDGEVCVCDIAERVGSERSNVSRHLAVMAKAGVLTSRKDGLQVFYALRTPCILHFFGCVENVLRATMKANLKALSVT